MSSLLCTEDTRTEEELFEDLFKEYGRDELGRKTTESEHTHTGGAEREPSLVDTLRGDEEELASDVHSENPFRSYVPGMTQVWPPPDQDNIESLYNSDLMKSLLRKYGGSVWARPNCAEYDDPFSRLCRKYDDCFLVQSDTAGNAAPQTQQESPWPSNGQVKDPDARTPQQVVGRHPIQALNSRWEELQKCIRQSDGPWRVQVSRGTSSVTNKAPPCASVSAQNLFSSPFPVGRYKVLCPPPTVLEQSSGSSYSTPNDRNTTNVLSSYLQKHHAESPDRLLSGAHSVAAEAVGRHAQERPSARDPKFLDPRSPHHQIEWIDEEATYCPITSLSQPQLPQPPRSMATTTSKEALALAGLRLPRLLPTVKIERAPTH